VEGESGAAVLSRAAFEGLMGNGKKTVLCVDDEEGVLQCLETMLSVQGYDVVTTQSVSEAETTLRSRRIDLIVLDVSMPDADGREACGRLRAEARTPVLFLTGQVDSFDPKCELAAEVLANEFSDGEVDVLYKPFSLAEIGSKIENLIGEA
jgi:CheY-like chemotaxis protein